MFYIYIYSLSIYKYIIFSFLFKIDSFIMQYIPIIISSPHTNMKHVFTQVTGKVKAFMAFIYIVILNVKAFKSLKNLFFPKNTTLRWGLLNLRIVKSSLSSVEFSWISVSPNIGMMLKHSWQDQMISSLLLILNLVSVLAMTECCFGT